MEDKIIDIDTCSDLELAQAAVTIKSEIDILNVQLKKKQEMFYLINKQIETRVNKLAKNAPTTKS